MHANFFETVRRLERKSFQQLPQDQRWQGVIGLDVLPDKEQLRFTANYQLSYSATSIADAGNLDDESFKTLLVNFLQLMGAEGALPQHYTKLIISRIKQRDYALADFIDMFHHRLVALFYRAWAKYRLVPQLEAHGLQNKQDPITQLIDALADHQAQDPISQRYYSGHFSKQVRSAQALQTLLADYLDTPINIDQHVGSWLPLEVHCLSQLKTHGNNLVQLGQGVLIGRRAWSVQSKIAVHIKELSLPQYKQLMPGTQEYQALKQLIRKYTPAHISIDLYFYVNTEKARIRFSDRPQLSKSAWIYSKPRQTLRAKANIQ